MNNVFKIEDLRPIRDEMTISRSARLGSENSVTYFSLGKGTSITQESYDTTAVYIVAKGTADFLIGETAKKAKTKAKTESTAKEQENKNDAAEMVKGIAAVLGGIAAVLTGLATLITAIGSLIK